MLRNIRPSSNPGRCQGSQRRFRSKALIKLRHLPLSVCAGGEGDGPVGVQMIDVGEGKKTMKRRVDGGGDFIGPKRGCRIVIHHFVFARFAAIDRNQLFQFIQIQKGEAGAGNRTEVAATALDGKHEGRFTGERIGQVDFGTRVSAGEVGDTKIGSEKIGAITEEFQGVV